MIEGLSMRLKKARKRKQMSQQQVADYLGISRENISQYETQGVTPVTETLMKLAALYDVSADYLLGIEKEKAVFVNGLNDTQKEALQRVADEFREDNLKNMNNR